VNGWVYGLSDGLIRDLAVTIQAPDQVDGVIFAALRNIKAKRGDLG
jgi:hypothetical protein